jgi:outer membrane protein
MKNLLLFVALFLFTSVVSSTYAQKFGYIDSDYIMSKMPKYAEAQKELNKASEGWQKELDKMRAQAEDLRKKFQAEEVLLTEEMKKERQDTILAKEKAMREFQKKIFGFDGMLFLKKQELIKPVQDKVFEAVEKVAKAKQLQIVFDKSGDLVMIYTNPVHDYSDYVLEELGLGDKNDKPDNERYNNKY